MASSSRPAFPLLLPALLAVALVAASARPASAVDGSAAENVRADFPDRRWTPVSAADAGLAGAGLATDPSSSAYANPALWLSAPWTFRLSAAMLNPNRDDLRATTVEFDEANGFPALGEAAVRFQSRGLGFGAYFAQPHYEHGETRFIGFNAALGGGGDPYPRRNTFTAATRLVGAGAAMRLKGGAQVGIGGEAVLTKESYRSEPDIPPGSFIADTLLIDRTGTAIGGVVGVAVPFAGKWTVGGSYRLAGTIDYDEGGSDDAPALGLLGVRYGRTAGSAVHAGLRWLGARTVDLADTNATVAEATADTRMEYSLGYAYLDPAGTWTVRAGGAISPAPGDQAARLTRLGISIGIGGEGLHGAIAYSRESESRPGDRTASRNLVVATVELGH